MSKLEEAKEILSSLKVPAKQQNGTMKNPKQFPPVKKTLYRVKGLSVSLREMVRT